MIAFLKRRTRWPARNAAFCFGRDGASQRVALALALTLLVVQPVLAVQNSAAVGDDQSVMVLQGQTMGTTYLVKISPPHTVSSDIAVDIDAELQRVNDQMSTYLPGSEVSRFNASESTEWFSVSPETAVVVQYALTVSEATDGAFDITVGPLVDAWSFGATPRTDQIPSEQQIESLRQHVGYRKLTVRLDPPALKKADPELRIDLSAIAKGHGVDRVVELLRLAGASHVFVEIGGEVRAAGRKSDGNWKVGIQEPSSVDDRPAYALELIDRSLATSGDYRNYFTVDGVRYSHTIDARTGRPITHDLASVSVLAESCMMADAWATALNVIGATEGLRVAETIGLDVLWFVRDNDEFEITGTGQFSQYASPTVAAVVVREGLLKQLVPLVIVTTAILGIIIAGMSVGVIFGRKEISGSCGGLANKQNEDGSTSCSLCSNPSDACSELREKMQKGTPS